MKPIPQRSPLRRWLFGAGLVLALGGGAWAAVAPHTLLYVKAKNTRLMTGSAVSATAREVLQPGAKVRYLEPDAKDKRWHKVKVEADGQTGYVFQSNLSRTPPQQEDLGDSNDTVQIQAYASKGAATKALGDGALAYGRKLQDKGETARRLLGLEALSRQLDGEVAERARKAGLFPVVGADQDARKLEVPHE